MPLRRVAVVAAATLLATTLSACFASNSPWNQHVPAGASYVDDPVFNQAAFVTNSNYSVPVVGTNPGNPVTRVVVPATWGWPALDINLRLPAGTDGAPGGDRHLVVIDGNKYYDFWVFTRQSASNATALAWAQGDWQTGTGWGTTSPWRAAGTRGGGSALLGGLIMNNEFTNGINHAVAFGLPGMPAGCPSSGYKSPAINGDGSCEGMRFGIPPGVPMPALTSRGANLWRALQTFGAFSADTVGGGAPVIYSQIGTPSTQLPTTGDLAAITGALRRVT
jgi:hypothetical protein